MQLEIVDVSLPQHRRVTSCVKINFCTTGDIIQDELSMVMINNVTLRTEPCRSPFCVQNLFDKLPLTLIRITLSF